MIKLLVDSTCDISPDFLGQHDIDILPLRIRLGDQEFRDKQTIQVDQVYDAMRQGIYPTTALPYPQDIFDLFQNYCTKGQDFIYLSFSSVMSGTYQLAHSIMLEFKQKYPRIKMQIIDTKAGSTAIGLIAQQTSKLIAGNEKAFDDIVKQVQHLTEHIEHVFTISDLSWLMKGGRVSKAEGIVGNLLNIKPILHVRDGAIEVYKKVRGNMNSLNSIVDILAERTGDFKDQVIGISHADDPEKAQQLVEMIKEKLGFQQFMVNKIGSVLGCHLGIGGVGVFFFNQNLLSEK